MMAIYRSEYDGWQQQEFACATPGCGWVGLGSETGFHEMYEALYEQACPRCGERILVITFPTFRDVREAAQRGVPEAQAALPLVETVEQLAAERSAAREKLTPDSLPDLDGDRLDFALELTESRALVLLHDGRELHREPAAWEDLSLVEQLVPLLEERYAERFGWLDVRRAELYLLGDKLGHPSTLSRLLGAHERPASR
jgi:hypothetical protein